MMSKVADLKSHFTEAKAIARGLAKDILTLPQRVNVAAESFGRQSQGFLSLAPPICTFKATANPLVSAAVGVVSVFTASAVVGAGIKVADHINHRETFKFFPSLARTHQPSNSWA